ncbi:hypothetical protein CEXT_83381 [Caerostris extrusa]|uniref:Period n=1 Tax=Caerostris extrusa TaxID=172846 RepID=A0AAV4M651_CAEEX|nr:hypothetical protein CEXT_83381 [Caerostris extrusa]
MDNENTLTEKPLSLHLTYLNDPDIQAHPVVHKIMENILRQTSSKVDFLNDQNMEVLKNLQSGHGRGSPNRSRVCNDGPEDRTQRCEMEWSQNSLGSHEDGITVGFN